jgi:hypothetical protein
VLTSPACGRLRAPVKVVSFSGRSVGASPTCETVIRVALNRVRPAILHLRALLAGEEEMGMHEQTASFLDRQFIFSVGGDRCICQAAVKF